MAQRRQIESREMEDLEDRPVREQGAQTRGVVGPAREPDQMNLAGGAAHLDNA
jgi:hypothetical protein